MDSGMDGSTLGDAGAPNDDGSYAGATPGNSMSMDYFRSKYLEFQQMLTAIDSAYNAGVDLWSVTEDETLATMLDEYQARKAWVKGTAEAMNAAATAFNALGGRMPTLSIPGSLGAVPFLLPAAVVAAVATVIVWGRQFIAGLVTYMQDAQALAAQDTPAKKAALAAALAKTRAAQQDAESPLASAAGAVKWVAIAAAAYLAWKAFDGWRSSNPALELDDPPDDLEDDDDPD